MGALQSAAIAMLAAYAISGAARPDRPNIIYILADDLGQEWISAYGASLVETPHIDKMAEEGLKFNGAYSTPKCTPTRVSLLTGQYPFRHGWVNHWDVPRWSPVAGGPKSAYFDWEYSLTFARVLKSRGYATAIAGKWQLNDFRVHPDALEKHGFDEWAMWTGYEGPDGTAHGEISDKRYKDPYVNIRRAGETPSAAASMTRKGEFGPDVFHDFLVDFMGRHKDEPQLIYYPMVLTHTPFTTTPLEPNATGDLGQHKAMVRYMDHLVGRLFHALDSLQLRERTLVIFTTDNGTVHTLTGKIGSREVVGGKEELTENGIWAPFIVSGPGVAKGTTSALTDITDIFPTFADLAGAALPADWTLDGKSIAKVIFGEEKAGPREWIMAMGGGKAVYEEGVGIKPVVGFAKRVLRDRDFKAYVEGGKVTRLVRVDSVPEDTEGPDLMNSQDQAAKDARAKFEAAAKAAFPSKDGRPIYSNAVLPDMPDKVVYDPGTSSLLERRSYRAARDRTLLRPGGKVEIILAPGEGELAVSLFDLQGNRLGITGLTRIGNRMSFRPAAGLRGIGIVELASGSGKRAIKVLAR